MYKDIEKISEQLAMNIVFQLDDDADLDVDFRQANNDKRIDFVKGLIQNAIKQDRDRACKEIEKLKIKTTECSCIQYEGACGDCIVRKYNDTLETAQFIIQNKKI